MTPFYPLQEALFTVACGSRLAPDGRLTLPVAPMISVIPVAERALSRSIQDLERSTRTIRHVLDRVGRSAGQSAIASADPARHGALVDRLEDLRRRGERIDDALFGTRADLERLHALDARLASAEASGFDRLTEDRAFIDHVLLVAASEGGLRGHGASCQGGAP
ncbi:hypothetical protein [Thetidibacter halocola]|uniref:Uncharacterized protein n=1 Tax=Thetidibacter halocola TaxID=2827239 RepID=A0A8J7WEL3_9RHOB|nr:hypothetical protein [Thetidibacter halocola]MBS0125367.1 hypothetical protein [Thetidibacter halocola]